MIEFQCEECNQHKPLYDSALDPIDYERTVCTECYDKRKVKKK